MNGKELADELENRSQWKLLNYIHWSEQAATMLRQQQDEITVLKQILSYEGIEVNLNECVEEFRKAQEK